MRRLFDDLDGAALASYLVGGVLKADLQPLRARSLKWGMLRTRRFHPHPASQPSLPAGQLLLDLRGRHGQPDGKAGPAARIAAHREPSTGSTPCSPSDEFVTYYGDEDRNYQPATIEGGDVHVIGNGAVLIGMGERTTPMAVETVAHALFDAGQATTVVAIELPRSSRIHAPRHRDVHGRPGHLRPLSLLRPASAQLDDDKRCDAGRAVGRAATTTCGTPWPRCLEVPEITVLTTDEDIRAAEREQWDDGTNYLAVAPGVVFGYDRNVATNTMLAQERHRGGLHRRQRARAGSRWTTLHDVSHPSATRHSRATTKVRRSMNLKGRSLLKEVDSHQRRVSLSGRPGLRVARGEAFDGTERQRMVGRNIALIFEKASTRTRSAFEVGAHDQGAHVTYLGPEESHIGHKETMKDTARVLGRMFDGIEYRGFSQDTSRSWEGSPVYRCGTA